MSFLHLLAKIVGAFSFCVACVAASSSWAQRAAPSAADQVAGFARYVAKVIQSESKSTVMLEARDQSTLASDFPNLATEVFNFELKTAGITVSKLRGDIKLTLTFKTYTVDDTLTVELIVEAYLADGKPLAELQKKTFLLDSAEAKIEGPDIPFQSRPGIPIDTQLTDSFRNPKQPGSTRDAKVDVVRVAEDSTFGFQVLVNGKPIAISQEGGIAFTEGLRKEDEFTILLINDNDFDCGAYVTLDGLDSCWLMQRRCAWIVPKKDKLEVSGWQLNNETAKPFKVGPVESSLAFKEGKTGQIGVISAQFYRAYDSISEVDSSDIPTSISAASEKLGITTGDRDVDNRVTSVDRYFGKLRANVPLRYQK